MDRMTILILLGLAALAVPVAAAREVSVTDEGHRISETRVLGIVHRAPPHEPAVWLIVQAKDIADQLPADCVTGRRAVLVVPANRFDVLRSAREALRIEARSDVEVAPGCHVADFRYFRGDRAGNWESR